MIPAVALAATLWRRIVPYAIGVVLLVALLVGLLVWAEHRGSSRVQRAWDAERAELQAQQRQAQAEIDQFEETRKRNEKEAADVQARRTEQAVADAAGARTELARLRGRLAALSAVARAGGPGAAGGSGDAATAADVLGECAGELQRVAGAADAMSVQISGLQDWIAAACTAPAPR